LDLFVKATKNAGIASSDEGTRKRQTLTAGSEDYRVVQKNTRWMETGKKKT